MRGTRAALAALALLVLPGPGPGDAAAQTARAPEVARVRFTGNRAFSDGRLRRAVATQNTTCVNALFVVFPFCPFTDWGFAHDRAFLDREELAADALRLRLFYRRRGWRSVTVDTAVRRLDGRVAVEFRVHEGRATRVGELEVAGTGGAIGAGRARELVPLEAGDPLDLARLEQGEGAIVDYLHNHGYPRAAVLREYFVPADGGPARVTLRVEPGPRVRVGSVRVTGAPDLGPGVVRQFLEVEPGQVYDRSAILDGQRNLYSLEAVRYANVRTESVPGRDSVANLTVDVTEAEMRQVRAGGGLTTTECGQVEASFTHRNAFGGARRFRLGATVSNIFADQLDADPPCSGVGEDPVFQDLNYRVEASFRQPYFLSPRNRLSASLFLGRETVPDIFTRNSRGGEAALTRRLSPRMTLTARYRPERTSFGEESADVFFCVNFGFCKPQDIRTVTEARWLSPFSLTWNQDRTNRTFSPTAGYYVTLEAETATSFTGSDFRYSRFSVDAADFTELAPGLVFGVHLRSGFVEPVRGSTFTLEGREVEVVHPRKRFFAGGPQSVRGFGQYLLGPTVLLLDAEEDCEAGRPLLECARSVDPARFDERPVGGNALVESSFELRYRLGARWQAVAFLDAGEVAADLGTIEAPVASPGVGFRFVSPVGPLRLDVGYDTSGATELPVVAEVNGELVELEAPVPFDPIGHDRPSAPTEFLRRLQVHLSIGQAF